MPDRRNKLSGKFVLRIDPMLHKKLLDASRSTGRSLNSVCVDLIEQGLGLHLSEPKGPWADIVAFLEAHFRDAFLGVAIFGSFARQEAREGSDVDLLVLLSTDRSISRTLYAEWDTKRFSVAGKPVNPHFVHPAAPETAGSLWFEAAIDGVILCEKQGRLSTCLRGIREYIGAGKISRQLSHGHAYWVRKAS